MRQQEHIQLFDVDLTDQWQRAGVKEGLQFAA